LGASGNDSRWVECNRFWRGGGDNGRSSPHALSLPWNVTPYAVIPLGWPIGKYGPTTRRPVGRARLARSIRQSSVSVGGPTGRPAGTGSLRATSRFTELVAIRVRAKPIVKQRDSQQLTGNGACSTGASYVNHAGGAVVTARADENLAHGDFATSCDLRCGEPRLADGDCHRSTASPSWVGWGVSLLSPAGAMPARMRNEVSSPVSRSPTNCHARLIPTPRSPMMT
jgi:hypothetical protein